MLASGGGCSRLAVDASVAVECKFGGAIRWRETRRLGRALPMKAVYLVGTRHDYQRAGNPGSEQLHAFVAATCEEQHIRAIGEEESLDSLSRSSAATSVCKQVADSLGIEHRYIDPSIEEQKALGIAHPGKMSLAAFSPACDYYEPDPEIREADAIRERRWLKQIVALNLWPTLFVCGAHHIGSFQSLLQTRDITVQVLSPKCGWRPS